MPDPALGTSGRASFTPNIAPRTHLLSAFWVNCYLIEDRDGITLVDTGLPRLWPHLLAALTRLGRQPSDLAAVVLTHAHFDHLGCAARLSREFGVPVWVHEGDRRLAAHPYRYSHERPRLLYPLRYPRSVPILAAMTAAGALRVSGVRDVRALTPGSELDVPGRPRVIATPGHTAGHCALHLPAADAVISGDALVTLDPYTGRRGPQIIAGAATADSAEAKESLQAIAATEARTVLPGHGEPWLGGARTAATVARARRVR